MSGISGCMDDEWNNIGHLVFDNQYIEQKDKKDVLCCTIGRGFEQKNIRATVSTNQCQDFSGTVQASIVLPPHIPQTCVPMAYQETFIS